MHDYLRGLARAPPGCRSPARALPDSVSENLTKMATALNSKIGCPKRWTLVRRAVLWTSSPMALVARGSPTPVGLILAWVIHDGDLCDSGTTSFAISFSFSITRHRLVPFGSPSAPLRRGLRREPSAHRTTTPGRSRPSLAACSSNTISVLTFRIVHLLWARKIRVQASISSIPGRGPRALLVDDVRVLCTGEVQVELLVPTVHEFLLRVQNLDAEVAVSGTSH